MKICFLCVLPKLWWQWHDGLYAAMKILERSYKVSYHLDGICNCPPTKKPDVVMAWGGTLSEPYKNAPILGAKKILLFAGGDRNPKLFEPFNLVCFENELHTIEARSLGVKCMTAFGTNTQLFRPIKQPKVFDAVYPGAFGLWKRKDLFAESVIGLTALTFGNIQKQEPQCWDICVLNEVCVSPDLPQEAVPYYLAMSRCVVVLPVSYIGGQRTVLEAMAMKLPVIVPSDAPLVCEFARHGGTIVDPVPEKIREAILQVPLVNQKGYEYVINNFTEQHYAEKLKIAIRICFQ